MRVTRRHAGAVDTTMRMRAGALLIVIASLVAVVESQATSGASPRVASQSPRRTATVAVVTTTEFRVAVVATRLNGASPPTAEVRVGLARRVQGNWREFGERRLGERYFWNVLSRPHAICRLEIETVGTRRSSGSQLTVQLLLSPSVGCGRIYRVPLPTR
jgi:hypothetical protein